MTTLAQLLQFYGVDQLSLFVNHLDRAETRRQHSAWLLNRLNQMENRLETLGLPRDCWKDGYDTVLVSLLPRTLLTSIVLVPPCLPATLPDTTDDLVKRLTHWNGVISFAGAAQKTKPLGSLTLREQSERPSYLILPKSEEDGFSLLRWLKDAKFAAANEAYWAAYGAWTAHAARALRRPEAQFLLGRAIEACDASLRFPAYGERIVRGVRQGTGSRGGRKGRGKAKTAHTKLIHRARTATSMRRPTLKNVLDVLSDQFDELSTKEPPLPIVAVKVDETEKRVFFEYAGDRGDVEVTFDAVEKTLKRAGDG
jgi:hypothetical protein